MKLSLKNRINDRKKFNFTTIGFRCKDAKKIYKQCDSSCKSTSFSYVRAGLDTRLCFKRSRHCGEQEQENSSETSFSRHKDHTSRLSSHFSARKSECYLTE